MRASEIIYDIKTLLQALTDDSRIKDAHILYKINMYRALLLEQDYNQTKDDINPVYYQRIPVIDISAVGSGDDPDVTGETIKFGKVDLPAMLQLGEKAPFRLYTAQKHSMIYPLDRMVLMEMIYSKDRRLDQFRYYIREGSTAYVYPYINKVSLLALLEDPMSAKLFYTTNEPLFNLSNGIEYTVTKGTVRETLPSSSYVIYKVNQVFTADLNNTYTGDGIVYRTSKTIDITGEDDYPCSASLAQRIAMEILTKDFQLEKQAITDIFNDAQDQLKVLRAGK